MDNTRTHENRLCDLPVIQEKLAASQEGDKQVALLGSYSASKFSVVRSMDHNVMAKFGMAVHFQTTEDLSSHDHLMYSVYCPLNAQSL